MKSQICDLAPTIEAMEYGGNEWIEGKLVSETSGVLRKNSLVVPFNGLQPFMGISERLKEVFSVW